jgi:hypothetical protein
MTEEPRDHSIAPFTTLALAVIKQAIEDATKDVPDKCPLDATRDQRNKWVSATADRNQARAFLTKENDGLLFWCRIAGLNYRTVLHYSKGAATDWTALGRLHRLHQVHTRALPDTDLVDISEIEELIA